MKLFAAAFISILSFVNIAGAAEIPEGEDLAALVEWQAVNYEILCAINFYITVLAVGSCLGLGLVMWRLVLLSKNQRSIF